MEERRGRVRKDEQFVHDHDDDGGRVRGWLSGVSTFKGRMTRWEREREREREESE